ncbi:hypothetical protein M9H77_20626 [Catharanthus roseus]|uniref:Uncharacterized protein n=1 Tax=Catharanthus roseus TaxID=4058 RepID=A0ACC0AK33_CATRO|nr:hypothetical protein M9H77_20626 [Catharanthus roseus]
MKKRRSLYYVNIITTHSPLKLALFMFSPQLHLEVDDGEMATSLMAKRRVPSHSWLLFRSFRSDSALEALRKASEAKIPNLVLYNYPSFSGAFSALFAHLYHSRLNLPCLVLPFSSAVPFRVNDVCIEGLRTCYFLDFLGPRGFASELSKRTSCKIIGFDHRKRSRSLILYKEDWDENLLFHVNLEKSSSVAVYEYFSSKLTEICSDDGHNTKMLNPKDGERVEMVLKYIEDVDLRRWSLADSKAFNIGINEWRSKLNCIMNPLMYDQAYSSELFC